MILNDHAAVVERETMIMSVMCNPVSTMSGSVQEVLATQHKTAVQQATLKELAVLTLERFWNQESRVINQTLHRLMGKRRLVLLGGEIQGAVEVKRRQVRHA